MNTNRTYASSAYRVTLAAGLAALALIFSYIEAIIPFNAGMRGKLENCKMVPEPFQGVPITLITASILSLSFMGFSGVVEGLFA